MGLLVGLILHLLKALGPMLVVLLLSPSLFLNVKADINHPLTLGISSVDSGYRKFRDDNCSEIIKTSLYHYSDHFHSYIGKVGMRNSFNFDYSISQANKSKLLPISQDLNTDIQTQESIWYVQAKPSCSNIRLLTIQELERNNIKILDFRDSRLGESSPKGGPSQQCLACDDCIVGYLLILTDDELSKSMLERLGFKHVNSMEKYIDWIRNGK
jgi:hypothetical protein